MLLTKNVVLNPSRTRPIRVAFFSNGPQLPTGYCYDDETEILTETGWKLFKDISNKEIVATLNLTNNELEYHQIDEKIEQNYSGDMFQWEGQQYNLKVTSNHRMLIKQSDDKRYKKQHDWIIEEANKTFNRALNNYQFKKDCKWKGLVPNEQIHIGKNTIQIKDYLSFMGWYLSEGYIYQDKKNNRVHISQSISANPKKHKEIVDLIKRMGFIAFRNDEKSDIGFHSKEMVEYLKEYGQKSNTKKTPEFIKWLPPEYISIFLDALFKGDGCFIYKKGINKYCSYKTTSLQLANDVHELLIKIGLNGRVKKDTPKKREHSFQDKLVSYSLSVNHYRLQPRITNKPKKVQYNGKIYCVQVHNGIVMVRRKGCALWSGNSKVIRELSSRLAKDSRFEVIIYNENTNLPEGNWMGIPVFGIPNYGDVRRVAEGFMEVYKKTNPDLIIFLEDSFTLHNFGFEQIIKIPAKRVFYIPLDGHWIPTTGVNVIRMMDKIVSMAKFTQETLGNEGFESDVIWHGVDLFLFEPVTPEKQKELKKKYGFKEDDFVIYNYGRNSNIRKNNQGMIRILCQYLKDAPENHYAFLHIMDYKIVDNDLVDYLNRHMLSEFGEEVIKRVRFSTSATYNQPASDKEMAEMLQMSDLVISASCLRGDTEIITNHGLVPIKQVNVGDKVLTHTGKFQNVIDKFEYPSLFKMYEIRPYKLNRPIYATGNHLVPVVRIERFKNGRVKEPIYQQLEIKEPELIPVDRIRKGDFVVMPRTIQNTSKEWNSTMFINQDVFNARTKLLSIDNADFIKILGYYLSEGVVSNGQTIFCLNQKKDDGIRKFLISFCSQYNLTYKITNMDRNRQLFKISSTYLMTLLENTGNKLSHTKEINWSLLNSLTTEECCQLLYSMWEGDGWRGKDEAQYTTVSKKLAWQVEYLLMRIGILASVKYSEKRQSWDIRVYGNDVEYLFERKLSCKKSKDPWGFKDDKYYYLQILSIKESTNNKTVYDLEVENDHTYCTRSMAVKNTGEGFGLIMAEGMACAKPVIHTDFTTPQELLMDASMGLGSRGWVVPCVIEHVSGLNTGHCFVDQEKFVEAIKYAVNHPSECKERGLNGRVFAERYLNWDYLIEQWKELILRMV